MKTLLIISTLLCIAVQADLEAERNKYHKAQEECESKLGEPKNLFHKIYVGEDIGDEHKAGAMALCISVKMGQMNEQGDLNVEQYKEHSMLVKRDENKVKEIISACGTKVGSTPEAAAFNFFHCAITYKPKI